jgi:hypothetical protein
MYFAHIMRLWSQSARFDPNLTLHGKREAFDNNKWILKRSGIDILIEKCINLSFLSSGSIFAKFILSLNVSINKSISWIIANSFNNKLDKTKSL